MLAGLTVILSGGFLVVGLPDEVATSGVSAARGETPLHVLRVTNAEAADASGTEPDGGPGADAPGGDRRGVHAAPEEEPHPLAPAASPSAAPAPVAAEVHQPAETGRGVLVEVVALQVVEAEGAGRGDIGGEAFRVELELTNQADRAVDLGAVVLTAETAEGIPLSPISGGPEAEPFVGEVGEQEAVDATYVFSVPPDAGDDLRLSFSYDTDAPVVVFSGRPDDS